VLEEVPVSLEYKGSHIDHALRIDLVVDDLVVVEVKAVEKLVPVHTAQLLTYMQYSRHRVGLLLNFHAPRLKDGLKRVVSTRHHRLRDPSR
jgi:GxxExxY protein